MVVRMSSQRHRSRCHGRLVARRRRRTHSGVDRRRSQRGCAVEEIGMRRRAGVPELHEDDAALAVHGVGDCRPRAHLRVGEQSGNVVPADRIATDPCPLGDDQPGRGTLGVVTHVQIGRQQVRIRCTATRQRRHDHPVGELELAHPIRLQQRLGSIAAGFVRGVHRAAAFAQLCRECSVSITRTLVTSSVVVMVPFWNTEAGPPGPRAHLRR